MELRCAHRPLAIVIADTFSDGAPHLEDLKERGYEVEFFRDPLDVLAAFARSMPLLAVVAKTATSPAYDLLMEDMITYGIAIDLTVPFQSHASKGRS